MVRYCRASRINNNITVWLVGSMSSPERRLAVRS
jgi:hypothetical protein